MVSKSDVVARYVYADLILKSTFLLSELNTLENSTKAAFYASVELMPSPPPEPSSNDWIEHKLNKAGAVGYSLAFTEQGFLLRFPGLADFIIDVDEGRISAWPMENANAETLRHLVLDQVLPRYMAQQGRLVIHAGAVRVDDCAIAFIGQTGAGKSTLTAGFHADNYPILSDDSLVVTITGGRVFALPTYSSLRLWPEGIGEIFGEPPSLSSMAHYSTKQRVLMNETARAEHRLWPLVAVYVLGNERETPDCNAIDITQLSPRDACMEIIRHAFQLDPGIPANAARMLAMASDVAARLPVYSLDYPRDYTRLPAVRDAILNHAGHHLQAAAGATEEEEEING